MTGVRAKQNGKNFLEKQAIVKEIRKNFEASQAAFFVDYKGITVAEVSALRDKFREAGVVYKVYKNNLVRLALEEMGVTGLSDQLSGSLAIAFSMQDEMSGGKIIVGEKFKDKMDIRFGLLGTQVLDKAAAMELATMPSKPELIGQLLSILQLAGARGLVNVLDEAAKKGAFAE